MKKIDGELMQEIGSEFWIQYNASGVENTNNTIFLLSGRTALRFIIDDIRKTRIIKKALLPSYCCESMIEPFIKTGIDVKFYHAGCDSIDFPYENDADIVLLIDFFGYEISENKEIALKQKQAKKVIIYDYTHKINGNKIVQDYADYSFCSYRKWFYCNFAKLIKHNGEFEEYDNLLSHDSYLNLRDEAAIEKKQYIDGLSYNKDEFLCKFNTAEEILDEDYVGYLGKPVDFSINEILSKRRNNASYLIKRLREISEIKLWRTHIKENDAPIFVPILVDPNIRNDLRRTLINEKIYCPIHWSKPSYINQTNLLYETELSLVCDQRYDTSDMERIVSVIKKFFNR